MTNQHERELTTEEREKTGLYTVLLASAGNPDFGEDPDRPVPGVPSHRVGTDTIAEASERCRRYIGLHGLGGGNWTGGEVLDATNGALVARISYNGRCWLPSKEAIAEHAEMKNGATRIAKALGEALDKAKVARQSRQTGKIDMGAEAAHLSAQAELFSALLKSAARDEKCIHSEFGSRTDSDHPKAVTPLVYLAQEASRHSMQTIDDLVCCALKAECHPDAGRDTYQCTPLHNAAEDGNTRLIEALAKAGADVMALDRGGRTPLHLATMGGHPDAITLLISCGADMGAEDDLGRAPMELASKSGPINALLDAGAPATGKDNLGRTPLHRHVDAKTIKRLLELGADPNARDYFGNSPLHINAYSKAGVVELLKAGSDPDVTNNMGQSPLSIALCGDESLPRGTKKASPGAAESLILAGADPGRPVSLHYSMPIMEACQKGMAAPGIPRDFDMAAILARREAEMLEAESARQAAASRKRI